MPPEWSWVAALTGDRVDVGALPYVLVHLGLELRVLGHQLGAAAARHTTSRRHGKGKTGQCPQAGKGKKLLSFLSLLCASGPAALLSVSHPGHTATWAYRSQSWSKLVFGRLEGLPVGRAKEIAPNTFTFLTGRRTWIAQCQCIPHRESSRATVSSGHAWSMPQRDTRR